MKFIYKKKKFIQKMFKKYKKYKNNFFFNFKSKTKNINIQKTTEMA